MFVEAGLSVNQEDKTIVFFTYYRILQLPKMEKGQGERLRIERTGK